MCLGRGELTGAPRRMPHDGWPRRRCACPQTFGPGDHVFSNSAGLQFDNIVLDDLTVSIIVSTLKAGTGGTAIGDPEDLGGPPVPLPGAAWLLATRLLTGLPPRVARGPRQHA